jgi:hypothetical protein
MGETSQVARSYRRLSLRDGKAFERLRRYDTGLWRQTVQLILLLNVLNRGASPHELSGRNVSRALWPPSERRAVALE